MNKRFQKFQRVTLTGPMSELKEAHEWLDKNGYGRRLYAGPLPIRGQLKVDTTKFKIVSEKEI